MTTENLQEEIKKVREQHKTEITKAKYSAGFGGNYLRDMVYGANDGIVTTFAVVAGVAGANLPTNIILIMGFANLFADGLSMSLGNYLGIKSELEYIQRQKEKEEWQVKHIPDLEKHEVEQLLSAKGFRGETLKKGVETITADKKRWVDYMLDQELGLKAKSRQNPLKNALVTFLSFNLAGLAPLLPYIFLSLNRNFSLDSGFNPFTFSIILTGSALFLAGSLRSLVTEKKAFHSGIEMFVIGALAAAAAYLTGFLIQKGLG